ncbi:NACHT, LRR and PYD domains-containing protein 1 homolog [Engraulis encrasicolus]|uniref:NACHT, LRR and PYD domains-containing protein 1 homolog n=1 Tax=Engraulis encrasicolus TaxID=184585 RepID=UPI002FD1F023
MFAFVMWRLHWVKRKKCAALDQYRKKICASPAAHYIQLLIARGKRELPDKEELIRTKEGYEPISMEDIFEPDKDHSLVILQGDPGHGKSFTAEKILREWATKAQYLQHFDLAVSLRCDELSIGSEPRGLLDLLSRRPDDESLTMELMKESPQKILIVIDSIDKIPLSQEDVKSSPSDPFSPAPAAAVLSGLLSRHILPQVFLLITTTHSASHVEKELCRFHQDVLTAQILGFTEEAVTKYCKSCFGGNTALCTSLVNNSALFSSCFNPMLCWITCEAMKKQDDLIDTVGTTTSVYLAFFGSFLKHLSLDKKQDLFRQAKKITIEENVLLDLTEIPCLEEGDPFRRSHHNQQGKAFIHQSFPEFFASLSYIDPHVTEDLLTLLNRDFSPGNSPSCHRQNVLKFLFGLSNKNIRSYIPVILGHGGPTQPEMGDPLHHWIKERADSRPWTMQTGLFLMQCLYELRDEDCVKEVMKRMGPMSFIRIPLTYDDVNALTYCLKLCPFIKKLELADCNLTAGKMTLLRDVWNTLDCDELWLTGEGLGCGDIEELIASLKQRVLSSPPKESAKKVVELHFLNGLLLQESDLIRRIAPSLLKVFEGSDITGSVSFKRDSNTPCSDGAWSLFHTKASDNQLTVSVKEPSGAEQGADPEVLSVSLTLQWSSSHLFNTDCHRCLSQHYQPSMVQDICSLPSVKELRMEVTHLTDDWAADLLCSTKPSSWPPDRKFRIVVVNMENSASLEVTALAKGMHRLEYSNSPDKKSVPRDIPTADLSDIYKCKTHLQSLK